VSLTVKSISPVPIADQNLPIALRSAVGFSPVRGSIFDDPSDEKSWHISQRSTSLTRYFEGREPSWYASAIALFEDAHRVLDLGCGPGLTLRALRDKGSSAVLGIDRWPAFVANSTPEAPIVAHDLSLPMPFLESGSFDGVLSHYVLDYVSPICVRQVLREAYRVLAPEGCLVLYMAAMGLGGGDESRTISYSPRVLRALLAEAGFGEVEVEASPNGRNSVARARRSATMLNETSVPPEPRAVIDGDTQLSASFLHPGDGLEFELSGLGHRAVFSVDLPSAQPGDDSRVAACARAQRMADGGTELQLWVWRGYSPLVAECTRVEFAATDMRITGVGDEEVGHVSVWSPGPLSLEPSANAHVRFDELVFGGDLSEVERGAEGRQVVVESADDAPVERWDLLGPGRNRFLIRQASRLDLATLDREWLASQFHGVAVTAPELGGEKLRELLLWCGWRQSLLYLGGADWESIVAVARRREAEMEGPVVLVDPALALGGTAQPLEPEVAAFAAAHDHFFVLLGSESWERSGSGDLALVSGRLLLGGSNAAQHVEERDADETLRYLTERTVLMRLRQVHGCSWAEVGRRPALS
jgi:SAM-dependent methyltransferase